MWRRLAQGLTSLSRAHSSQAPSLEHFHARLRQMNAQKRASNFRSVLQEMEMSGVEPDAPIYRTLIMGGMQAKRLQDVMHYYHRMRTSGIPVDVVLYNAVISTCARVGELQVALQVLRDLQDIGVEPNERTYVSLLNVCAAVGNANKAEELLADMEEQGLKPNAFAYSAVIASIKGQKPKRSDALERIDAVVEKARGEGLLDPDAILVEDNGKEWDQRAILYNALLGAYVQLGEFERADEIWNSMAQENMEPASLTVSHMLTMHLKKNDMDKALEVFAKFRATGKLLPLVSYMQILRMVAQKDGDQGLEIATTIVEDLREKGYFLSTEDGSFILTKASEKADGRGMELANQVWECMAEHEKRLRPNSVQAYVRALESYQPDNYTRVAEVKRIYADVLEPPAPRPPPAEKTIEALAQDAPAPEPTEGEHVESTEPGKVESTEPEGAEAMESGKD
eukprot:jgi/Pico_ML_1/52889/g3529.t1